MLPDFFKFGKIIKNSKIPKYLSVFINIYAITIWPFIIFSDEGNVRILNHERIHIRQQAETLLVGFYFLYILFWIIGLTINVRDKDRFHKAYMWIPFEKEAHYNDSDLTYLVNRKKFSWIKYIGT